MKPAQPINLGGTIYYIDNDAYALLDNYLCNIKNAFTGPDEADIAADIEARAAELLGERCISMVPGSPAPVTIADVQGVIAILGNPEDMIEETPDVEAHNNVPEPPPFRPNEAPAGTVFIETIDEKVKKKLFRNLDDKVFGGVISGICSYLNWSTPLVRFLVVILCIIFNYYQWPIVVYLIAWGIIPAAKTAKQKLEMRGEAVTIDAIGQTVQEDIAPSNDAPAVSYASLGNIAS